MAGDYIFYVVKTTILLNLEVSVGKQKSVNVPCNRFLPETPSDVWLFRDKYTVDFLSLHTPAKLAAMQKNMTLTDNFTFFISKNTTQSNQANKYLLGKM